MRTVMIISMCLSLAACGSTEADTKADKQRWMIEKTKTAVQQRLKDPESAEFSDVHTVEYQGATVVCGHVNAKNSFGGKSGMQRFVGAGDTVFLEEDGASAVAESWVMFGC